MGMFFNLPVKQNITVKLKRKDSSSSSARLLLALVELLHGGRAALLELGEVPLLGELFRAFTTRAGGWVEGEGAFFRATYRLALYFANVCKISQL